MFSLVFFNAPLFFFLHVVFCFCSLFFHMRRHHKGLAAPATSERSCLRNMLLGNNTVSTMVLQEVPSVLYEFAAPLVV